MTNKCVRDQILNTIDDLELTCRDLFETLLTPKPMRQQMGYVTDIGQFAELIVAKHKELQLHVQVACEQENFEKKMDDLRQQLHKEEDEIQSLQKKLKEAEHILATAIYQAKQKLKLIRKANENSIPSDELIKYAHKISSSHAVAAPYNWEQGDPRRPYPTDMEMKLGLIGQSPDFQLNTSQTNASTGNNTPSTPFDGPVSGFFWNQSSSAGNATLSAGPGGDIKMGATSSFASNLMDVKANGSKDNLEDVEVMSTDSSSSSSSDSQ